VRDILIAHILVGRAKADRLAALQRTALVRTTVDHPDQLAWLSDAAQSAGTTIGVLVDLDIGLGRTGVRTVEAAVDLGRRVAATRGLRLDGLMGYEGHALYIQDAQEKESAIAASISRLVEGRDAFRSAGLPCPIVSAGGSGSYQLTSRLAGVTELQAGGGIFACPYYFELCQVERHRTAIFILTSVVSRPQPDHIICDAGLKALSNFRSQPRLPQFPQARLLSLSAEHSTFEIPPECVITLGDKLQLVPGYSDLTIFLHDWMLGLRGERVETVWPLLARGALQ
jgi:D-serine deaminase-like pyridoxal phosphate-dependent protein